MGHIGSLLDGKAHMMITMTVVLMMILMLAPMMTMTSVDNENEDDSGVEYKTMMSLVLTAVTLKVKQQHF